MRIERRGEVSRMTPRLERFLVEALKGAIQDDLQDPEQRRVDFSCLRGLLAIEVKTLAEDGSERIDNLTDEFRERPDWPMFLGSAPMQSIFKHLDKPEEAKRRFVDRVGRAIKNHLSKANKQLGAHERNFPRKNLVKVMLLINEDHEIYDPKMVTHIVHHLVSRRNPDGKLLHPNIDAVVFFTERHAMMIDGQITFPVMCIEGCPTDTANWKIAVLDHFLEQWADWNGRPLFEKETQTVPEFSTIDHIPDEMKLHEKWSLDYRRNPYMQSFSKEQLRNRLDEIMCVNELAFIKGSPFKPDQALISWSMESMSHIMIEMGHRAIPITDFPLDQSRLASAAKRLGLPTQAVGWLIRRRDQQR